MKNIFLMLLISFLIVAFGTHSALAKGRKKVGEVRGYHAESPHPYPQGKGERPEVWTDTVVSPNATFIRIHFVGFHLEPGDFVTVSSLDGSQEWVYRGKGPHGNGNFWTFSVDGDTAIVRIHGGPVQGHGYRIDAVGHGTEDFTEVICWPDGREPIACHIQEEEVDSAQKPVALLIFQSGPFLYACTGFLVDGSTPNTLMTANHCISTQTETETLEARFNYQYTTCDGYGLDDDYVYYNGGTLLKTNSVDMKGKKKGGLDYTLLTLQKNSSSQEEDPESIWGKLKPTIATPSVRDQMWFIQHPGGRPKEIGYYQDNIAPYYVCQIDEINQTYGRSARESQMAYKCDSEGGSSGSPIIDSVTGLVIGLHHFGGVSNDLCLNAATMMGPICEDAGSLLKCVESDGCTPIGIEGPYDNPTCDDDLDNDCDGLTDSDDPNCQPPSQADCSQYTDRNSCRSDSNCKWKKGQCFNR